MVRRYGFTMIELIFAIVIIAISVMSLPMMTQVTTSSSITNLESDEAIFAAYVKALEATDENFSAVSSTTIDAVAQDDANGSLQGLKFEQNYVVDVTTNGSFGSNTNDANIKKVAVYICDKTQTTTAGCKNNPVTVLYTYKFNF
jgi:prepilin-type N-terminal cleavage/methylation domain-containing protein